MDLPLTGGCEAGFEKAFCSHCGSALFSSYHQYVAYAVPWEPIPDDGLQRHPESRPGR